MTKLRAFLALVAFGLAVSSLQAQQTGRLIGRVLDEASGTPVPGAHVGVAAGGISVTTGVDGRYTFMSLPAGPIALAVRAIGYSPKTVSGIIVPEGGVARQDITLLAQTVQVGEITVSAAAERGSAAAALDEQRNSSSVINAVTAEQIARTPDSDAAQAVQRVSGVTVQDGRYVFVRGLGERYTTTSLNGSRMPSPEPERRAVPLDLFPSNLLDGITTTKSFSPDMPGDFSGAQVNLRTREFPLQRTMSMSLSSGGNSAATGRGLTMAPSLGREWLGFAGAERELPGLAAGDLSGLTLDEAQDIIGSFRNSWSLASRSGSPNGGFGASIGGEEAVAGLPLGYVASFGYSYGTDVRLDEQRAVATPGGTPGTTTPINEYSGTTASQTVLWGGLLNLTARIAGASKIAFNNTFTRSADNTGTVLRGLNEEFGRDFEITRQAFVERSVRSHQLQGQHALGARHQAEWGITSAAVRRSEPDRSDLIYDHTNGTPEWFGQGRSAVRTFASLDESSLDLSASYRFAFGNGAALKTGASRRTVDRDADARGFTISNLRLTDAERAAAPEQIFSRPNDLFLQPDVLVGRYRADDAVTAGYLMAEVPLGQRLRLVTGARVESWRLALTTYFLQVNRDSTLHRQNTDVLPSLSLNYQLSGSQNLRFSASQTLSRPEYREVAFTTSRDIAGGVDQQGNARLQRALIRNVDLRWEWYPRPGETFSIGVFAKSFEDPIERVMLQSASTPTTSWENAEGAENYGVEFEVRRSLDVVSPRLAPFWVSLNATLMRSEIRVDTLTNSTNANRPMAGQAPYVLNSAIGYSAPSGWFSATLLHNVVGRRIFEAGIRGQPDAEELPRHVLDLSLRTALNPAVSLKLDFKNLLDAPYEIVQGQVTRLKYRTGRQIGFGIGWQP